MNIYQDMLFLHGYVTDPRALDGARAEVAAPPAGGASERLAPAQLPAQPRPAAVPVDETPHPIAALEWRHPATRLFAGMFPLPTAEPATPRLELDGPRYGPSFGNRIASLRAFGGATRTRDHAPALADCLAGACS